MRALSKFAVLFYSLVCLALGFILILVAFNTFPMDKIIEVLQVAYKAPNVRLAVGASGVGIIFIGLLIAQITAGKIRRERTIAFENPEGQVTISLSAIEDLIKRVARQIPGIKELRPSVIAGKKGVCIVNQVSLLAGANIPEITEKIQNIIKGKVHGMLGIEEPILVKIHVSKIVPGEKPKGEKEETDEPIHRFKGIEYSTE